jgi:hypothetical protein
MEKRPSKKKGNCNLRGASCSCTFIFEDENGSLRLQK